MKTAVFSATPSTTTPNTATIQALSRLSEKALFFYIQTQAASLFDATIADLQRFVNSKQMKGYSLNPLYTILAELETVGLAAHFAPAPFRPATYHFTKFSDASSIYLSSSLDLNKNNDCACDTSQHPVIISDDESQLITTQASKYGLTANFLREKVAERKAAGKPFSADILEFTLATAKEKATKDFAGLFYTMFVKRGVFASPYVAQESGYVAPKPAARVIEPADVSTQLNANVNVLRAPVKTIEEQQQHYATQAAVIPPEMARAMDAKILTDGLTATKAAFLAGKVSAAQARSQVAGFMGNFAPDVWALAETAMQDVMAAIDRPVIAPTPPVSQGKKSVTPEHVQKLAGLVAGIGN